MARQDDLTRIIRPGTYNGEVWTPTPWDDLRTEQDPDLKVHLRALLASAKAVTQFAEL